jgi:hypothetical protein
MRIYYPDDIVTDAQRDAYKRGWCDRAAKQGKRGGGISSPAKQAAARANGAKGGRPRLTPPVG